MKTRFSQRRRALQAVFAQSKLDHFLVTKPANLYYLTGFTGDAGVLVISQGGASLVTDGRFMRQARKETSGVRIVLQKSSLFPSVGAILQEARSRRAGFDPDQLAVAQLQAMQKVSGSDCRWVAAPGLVENMRMRKETGEMAQMRRAGILAGQVLEGVLALLKPGVREIEIGAEIDYQMRRRGASGPSFETIVASGGRSALPHARPTAKRLRKNELVVLDLGAILGHYCSDITRTVFLGRSPARIRRLHRAVLEAQEAAIAAVKDGAPCGDVDAAARQVLAGYRLDRYFAHSTGHGLGLEVHENPRIAPGQKQRLVPGNVITIEPGVYVAGVGGIRIEDDVAVHADRTEVITRVPRDFIEL
jgi:Xaa-Pro aminopeptidase